MEKTKPSALSQGARAMAQARWANVPAKERSRLMQIAGRKGGSPRSRRKRCFCGANTMKRAISRNFDCCRAAGVLNLDKS